MQYEESTPVTSDINTAQRESVVDSLALSIKHSLLITQLNSTFRMGSKPHWNKRHFRNRGRRLFS